MTLAELDLDSRWDRDRLAASCCFRIRHPLFPLERCQAAIELAGGFFRMDAEKKQRLAIEGSPHYRGYSVMQDHRDWREQIHFGREERPEGGPAVYERLRGPNLWPEDAGWRDGILRLIADLEAVGREILAALARSLGLPPSLFLPADEAAYLLLKLIHYRESPDGTPRSGVAPHVDFSWITLLLQDDAGGLQIRQSDGTWQPVPVVPGTLLVNAGEILEFATGGYFRATPHRVVNGARSRISLPFFLNPGLSKAVSLAGIGGCQGQRASLAVEGDPGTASHVHRVFAEQGIGAFVFGDEEWKRKGEGIYCGSCFQPPGSAKSRARS